MINPTRALIFGLSLFAASGGTAVGMPIAPLKQAVNFLSVEVVQVYHRGQPHRQPRVTIYPQQYYAGPGYGAPYYFDDLSQYPYTRGFMDRNPVPRGNLRGCTVDLGYGRYETCDQ